MLVEKKLSDDSIRIIADLTERLDTVEKEKSEIADLLGDFAKYCPYEYSKFQEQMRSQEKASKFPWYKRLWKQRLNLVQ